MSYIVLEHNGGSGVVHYILHQSRWNRERNTILQEIATHLLNSYKYHGADGYHIVCRGKTLTIPFRYLEEKMIQLTYRRMIKFIDEQFTTQLKEAKQ